MRCEDFDSKIEFSICFSGSGIKLFKINIEFMDFTIFLCLLVGGACFFVGFLIVAGLMMAVMANSITLPLQTLKSMWVAKNQKLVKIYFNRLPKCYSN